MTVDRVRRCVSIFVRDARDLPTSRSDDPVMGAPTLHAFIHTPHLREKSERRKTGKCMVERHIRRYSAGSIFG